MSTTGILVKLQARAVACLSVTTWHSESALLVCSFAYETVPAGTPASVAERIDTALGVSITLPRALLGDVELTWRDENRLHSIELRTGPGQWERASLGAPNGKVEEALITLGLDYDTNRVASIELDVHVLWDPALARIALRFGKAERRTERWFALANNAFVDVDDTQMLREIRLANVSLVSDGPS